MKTFLPIIIILAITPQISGVAGIGNCAHVDTIGAEYWYQWKPYTQLDCNAEFVPMMRDAEQATELQTRALGFASDTMFFGFNEPDLESQASLTPQEAISLERWKLEHYPGLAHVAPSPSQENIYWLRQMRNAYIDEYGEPPNWTYLAAHCYFWDDTSIARCKAIVGQYIQWSNAWGYDGVIVSEFGSFAFREPMQPGAPFDYVPAVQRGREFMQWMRGQEEIKGYFWYSAHDWGVWPWYATTALFDANDELTPLGEMYRNEVQNARHKTW